MWRADLIRQKVFKPDIEQFVSGRPQNVYNTEIKMLSIGVSIERIEIVPNPERINTNRTAVGLASRIAADVVAWRWICTPIFVHPGFHTSRVSVC